MAKKIALYGVLGALAIIIASLERFFPLPVPVPGIKLGLANIVVLVMLYTHGFRPAFAIAVLRIVAIGLLFGTGISIIYALSGGIVSFLVMAGVKKTNIFGVVGVSVFGAVAHNIAQIGIAALMVQHSGLLSYSPVLIVAGVATGILIGYVAGLTFKNVRSMSAKN
ncbi:MAG: Gx transporter family protein [Defluviitaleaceae bacterium]|nr:Gx transporter family protein [Defluviitaleaceae bacterium]